VDGKDLQSGEDVAQFTTLALLLVRLTGLAVGVTGAARVEITGFGLLIDGLGSKHGAGLRRCRLRPLAVGDRRCAVGRHITRTAVAASVLVGTVLGVASPAWAHAVLLRTSPASGYSVAGPVSQIRLTFSEPVSASPDAVGVTGPTPGLRSVAVAADGGRTLVVATGLLHDGPYLVRWQVTADDGDVVDGSYTFGVGSGAGPDALSAAGRAASPAGSLLVTAVLRWALFAALAVALGGLVGQALIGRLRRHAEGAGARPLPLDVGLPLRAASLVGAVAALALTVHALDGSSWAAGAADLLSWSALTGPGARLPALEMALFGASAIALARPGKARRVAAVPLLAVALVEGLRGHLHQQDGSGGALLIAVHVALAAAWTGALVVVLRTAASWRRAGRGNAAWQLVGLYSRSALAAYLLVVGTGTLAAVRILPTPGSLVTTGYGQVLGIKLLVVAIVTGLALHSRQRLRREDPALLEGRRRWWQPRAMALLLAAAALLVSVSPPRLTALAQQTQPPPAPTGPVVELGSLAGQLTVGVSVSTGLLRLQVSNPASDDREGQTFTTNAALSRPGQRAEPVGLRPCGPGCFAAPVDVGASGLGVSVRVASPGWTGGTATFEVPWPPIPVTALLTRALDALRGARLVTIVEQVNSDTSRPAPIAVTLHDTGVTLLSTEPYSDTASLASFALPPHGTDRRVAFGVGGTYFVELTLDAAGRVAAERLVTPNHLIVRTFTHR